MAVLTRDIRAELLVVESQQKTQMVRIFFPMEKLGLYKAFVCPQALNKLAL